MKHSWKGIILIKIAIYWTPTMRFNILCAARASAWSLLLKNAGLLSNGSRQPTMIQKLPSHILVLESAWMALTQQCSLLLNICHLSA